MQCRAEYVRFSTRQGNFKFVDAKLALSMYSRCYVIPLLSSRSPHSCLFLIPLSKLDKGARGNSVMRIMQSGSLLCNVARKPVGSRPKFRLNL